MNSELRKAKGRADQSWTDSVLQATVNAKKFISIEFIFREWSNSVSDAYHDQWFNDGQKPHFDWPEVKRRHRGPKERIVAVFLDDRLCLLSLIKHSRERVLVRFLEGDPRPDCPLKGARAALLLEVATIFGQRLGCKEIHLEPIEDDLKVLYEEAFGFESSLDGSNKPILKRTL